MPAASHASRFVIARVGERASTTEGKRTHGNAHTETHPTRALSHAFANRHLLGLEQPLLRLGSQGDCLEISLPICHPCPGTCVRESAHACARARERESAGAARTQEGRRREEAD